MLSKINRMKSIGRASGIVCALYRKGFNGITRNDINN